MPSLYDSKPEAVVAGVPRAQAACYDAKDQRPGMFFCENNELGAFADPSSPKTFNAGVVLADLEQWRALKLGDKFIEMTRAHARKKLWRLGSNPPLVLLAHGRFEALDQRWNCDGLGWKKPTDLEPVCLRDGAFVWHWSGPRKPWLADGLYPASWWPHVRDARCLLGLPGVPPPSTIYHAPSTVPFYALLVAQTSAFLPAARRAAVLARRRARDAVQRGRMRPSASRASSSAPRFRFFGGASAGEHLLGEGRQERGHVRAPRRRRAGAEDAVAARALRRRHASSPAGRAGASRGPRAGRRSPAAPARPLGSMGFA